MIAVALLADFNVDGDPVGEAQQSDFFQASSCGSPSLGGVESGLMIVSRSLAAARKSSTVGALDLSNNSSSSGVASGIGAGFSSFVIIVHS
jgi:hypothetical protein